MKSIIIIALIFISLNSYGQKDDSTHRAKVDTVYQINLTKIEFLNLVNVIKQLDEKPSILKAWIEENIYKKTQLVLPNKEKKK